jgi:hypothetical protein
MTLISIYTILEPKYVTAYILILVFSLYTLWVEFECIAELNNLAHTPEDDTTEPTRIVLFTVQTVLIQLY